jgi:hypothetical protein
MIRFKKLPLDQPSQICFNENKASVQTMQESKKEMKR